MMNSLFFLGVIKGHTTKKTYSTREKKVIFVFFMAEDIINIAIGSNNLWSEAGTDQPSHILN